MACEYISTGFKMVQRTGGVSPCSLSPASTSGHLSHSVAAVKKKTHQEKKPKQAPERQDLSVLERTVMRGKKLVDLDDPAVDIQKILFDDEPLQPTEKTAPSHFYVEDLAIKLDLEFPEEETVQKLVKDRVICEMSSLLANLVGPHIGQTFGVHHLRKGCTEVFFEATGHALSFGIYTAIQRIRANCRARKLRQIGTLLGNAVDEPVGILTMRRELAERRARRLPTMLVIDLPYPPQEKCLVKWYSQVKSTLKLLGRLETKIQEHNERFRIEEQLTLNVVFDYVAATGIGCLVGYLICKNWTFDRIREFVKLYLCRVYLDTSISPGFVQLKRGLGFRFSDRLKRQTILTLPCFTGPFPEILSCFCADNTSTDFSRSLSWPDHSDDPHRAVTGDDRLNLLEFRENRHVSVLNFGDMFASLSVRQQTVTVEDILRTNNFFSFLRTVAP